MIEKGENVYIREMKEGRGREEGNPRREKG